MPVYKYLVQAKRTAKEKKILKEGGSLPPTKMEERWYFSCYYTDYFTGQNKRKVKRGFLKQKDAVNAEHEFAISQNTSAPGTCSMKFSELTVHFMEYAATHYKPTTYNHCQVAIKYHILPYFKNRLVRSISKADIQKWMKEINKAKSLKTGELYRTETKRGYYTILSLIFEYAIEFHGISINPVKLCKQFSTNLCEVKEMEFYTPEEFKQFVSGIKKFKFVALFNVLFYSGMRIGELLALQWDDIDFAERTIYIRKSLSDRKCPEREKTGKNYIITTPKTKSSIRKLLMPQRVMFLLERLKQNYKEDYYGFNEKWYVFGKSEPMCGGGIRYQQSIAEKESGVKHIKIHGFRHSHASNLINLGAPISMVSQRLGHCDTSTTLDIYTHLLKNSEATLIDIMDEKMT